MYIELLIFMNIFPHSLEEYISEEDLGDVRLGRNEDPGGFIACVGCPGVRPCDGEEIFPLRKGGYDLEWLGQFS